jgi:hypothetical protein
MAKAIAEPFTLKPETFESVQLSVFRFQVSKPSTLNPETRNPKIDSQN